MEIGDVLLFDKPQCSITIKWNLITNQKSNTIHHIISSSNNNNSSNRTKLAYYADDTAANASDDTAVSWMITLCTVFTFGQICNAFVPLPPLSLAQVHSSHEYPRQSLQRMISSGFSFSDGEQLLVSLQKPLGILLEQETQGPIIVADVN